MFGEATAIKARLNGNPDNKVEMITLFGIEKYKSVSSPRYTDPRFTETESCIKGTLERIFLIIGIKLWNYSIGWFT